MEFFFFGGGGEKFGGWFFLLRVLGFWRGVGFREFVEIFWE